MKTPHLDKLNALFVNPKLPDLDREKKQLVMERYHQWIGQLQDTSLSKEEYLQVLVNATNTYKNFIDIDFIFSSEDNFLYRQKGQLKLDNTVLEECLPYLVDRRLVPGLFEKSNIFVGDEACYAGLSFGAWLSSDPREMFFVKKKNQDFAVGKRIDLSIKDGSFEENLTLNIAYFAAELKTNLDKTMFQEASATARELKTSVQKSNYYLVTEWLDMTPIDSASTSIDSVIVLRKAKRLNSNVRSNFSTVDGRQSYLAQYRDYIESNPLALDMVTYIVDCLNTSIPQSSSSSTEDHLSRGYF